MVFEFDGDEISALDAIVRTYFKGEKEAQQNFDRKSLFPPKWARLLELIEDTPTRRSITLIIRGFWNIYEGRLEAYLLDGSYNFTSEEFIGSQSGPVIDLQGINPGPNWKLLDEVPHPQTVKGFIKSVCILTGGNAKEALLKNLGPKPLILENIDLSQLKAV